MGEYMKIFLNRVLTGLVCLLAAGWVQSQQVPVIPALAPQPVSKTIQTNNPDIVVKQVSCVDLDVGGVVVNKGTQAFSGILHIAVKDEEGDVVGRNKVRLRVAAENGARFSFYYINTLNCFKHKFDFRLE
jgi:hypothetical protein